MRRFFSFSALSLFVLAGLPGMLVAAQPASGTLSVGNPVLTYTSGPFNVSNPSSDGSGGICADPAQPCDHYDLTVDLPADYASTNPGDDIRITTVWPNVAEDFDVYLLNSTGGVVTSAASSDNPEIMEIFAGQGMQSYRIRIIPFAVAGGSTVTTIELVTPAAGGGPPPAPMGAGLPPRFQIHVAPPNLGNAAGEPSIGYNPFTERAMFISNTQALRMTFREKMNPPLPQACTALWEDKSGTITTANTLDPILFTDPDTGRTFNSQLSGANSLFEFTDDDGESWMVGQAGPPNGGADHQTVGAGPYTADTLIPHPLYPNAVYYCSQSVSNGFCARSDDGGQTFGPGATMKNPRCSAGALHGHVKVAPDGTAYVPDSMQCVVSVGATEVFTFVSEDDGVTWEARFIPGSVGGAGSDPSIGVATDNTIYMCWEDGDSSVWAARSDDAGRTWVNAQNIGASLGLVQTRFPHAIAGDPDRAGCAFLGTTSSGDGNSLDFKGIWYPYVATTYDGGLTWHVVNIQPDDPVQGEGGVGPSGTNRNLLDFNDLQLGSDGRMLFAYADGCVGSCVQDQSKNSFADKATVGRQVGGRTLLSAFDDLPNTRYNTLTPLPPAAACAVQERSSHTVSQTLVSWNAPDDGGSAITNYQVFRALAADELFEFVGDAGTKTTFIDPTASPEVDRYFYRIRAENAEGEALDSNIVELVLSVPDVVDTCTLPGEIIAADGIGDADSDDLDIEYLAVAEPEEMDGFLVITYKVVDFAAGQPAPNSFYPLLFASENNLYISLDSTQGPPKFTYGTFQDVQSGVLVFTEAGELDPRSAFSADGSILMVTPKSFFSESEPGNIIVGFDARSRIGAQSNTSRDTAGPADYTVRGTAICGDPGIALADLSASPQEGTAPLTVNFTVGGTPATGAAMDLFSINFGDGQRSNDRSFNGQSTAQISHVYQTAGTYPARLTVTDSAGNISTNNAQQFIDVEPGQVVQPPPASVESQGRGGALPGGLLLALGLLAGRRRRISV